MNSLQNKFNDIEKILNSRFLERSEEIHGLNLGLISGLNTLLIGPPGTGKTLLVSTWSKLIKNNKHFNWLLHSFLTPEELFGPISLKALEEERFSRNTAGKLPEANTCFLDEIFKCNAGSLNALLSVLNEHVFFNDGKAVKVPLRLAIGASNELPEESENLQALDDRFPIRFLTKPIQENTHKAQLLSVTHKDDLAPVLTLQEADKAREEADKVDLSEDIVYLMLDILNGLKDKGIMVTDRTFRQSAKIIKAEAYLKGRDQVENDDIEVLKNVYWKDNDHKKDVYSTILNLINPEKDKIASLYDDAEIIYLDAMKLSQSKNSKKVAQEGLEIADKLKNAKQEMGKLIKDMKSKGKNLKECRAMETRVESWLEEVFNKLCGVDFGFTER